MATMRQGKKIRLGVTADAPRLTPTYASGGRAMHGTLMRQAESLVGCTEGSDEAVEFMAIIDAIEPLRGAALAARQGPGRTEKVGRTDFRGSIRIGICRDRSRVRTVPVA